MKTTKLCLTLLLMMGVSLQSKADEVKTVKSKLDEAIVFFQGAQLTHSVSTALTKGPNELIIEGLSPTIDKNSLKIKTSGGAVISAYEHTTNYMPHKDLPNPMVQKMQDSVTVCKGHLTQLATNIKITQESIDLLKRGIDKSIAGSTKENMGIGIDDLMKTMAYFQDKSTELQTAQNKNFKLIENLNNTVSRLEAQVRQESTKNTKTSVVLKLSLSTPLATNYNLTISYYTPSASWIPYYDINVASTDKPIKISMKSQVRQTTGLDWNKVKLSLSTATPSNGKVAPLFNAWYLQQLMDRRDLSFGGMQNSYSYDNKKDRKPTSKLESEELSEVVRGSSSVSSSTPLYVVDGKEMSAAEFGQIAPDRVKNVEVLKDASSKSIYGSRGSAGIVLVSLKNELEDFITESANDLNLTFNIDLPYTIPGNGKIQNIDLVTKETEAEYKYYCAPKLDSEAYLLAEISNWQRLSLLSGKANITYDGTYVGETVINAASTHEKLALTLGNDKRVVVRRERVKEFNAGSKFMGSDVKQMISYKITVKNNQNKSIMLVLKDQYPLSSQKNIDVELLTKETTPWTVNKEDVGVITWEETLASGASKEYRISYSVKHPKSMKLNL